MARSSRGGWLLYVMVHVPGIWRFKVGITSLHIGASKRAKNIDRKMFGFPLPIMILPVPFAYRIEQEMHRIMSGFQTRFYTGDGSSEWFIIAPILFAVPVMLSIWGIYLAIFDAWAGTKLYPVLSRGVFELIYQLIF